MSEKDIDVIVGDPVQVTGSGTTVVLASMPLVAGMAYSVEAEYTLTNQSLGTCAKGSLSAAANKIITSTLDGQSSDSNRVGSSGLSAAVVAFALNGDALELRLTGIALVTINAAADLRIVAFAP